MNLYLVRHAHAGDRGRWTGPHDQRPLSSRGRDQAAAITDALASEPITRIISSPAGRCQQTVEPLAKRLGLPVEINPALAEGGPLQPVRELIDALAREDRDTVVCGHGDVPPELLHDLEREGAKLNGSGFAKGSVWHLVAENGRYVRGRHIRHPDGPIRHEA